MDTTITPEEYKAFSLDARAALAAGGMSEDDLQMIIARTGTDAAYVGCDLRDRKPSQEGVRSDHRADH